MSERFVYLYADGTDILKLMKGSSRQHDKFLSYVNNIHLRLKSIVEIETNINKNFLDLTLYLHNKLSIN